jgi:hypothetical protein
MRFPLVVMHLPVLLAALASSCLAGQIKGRVVSEDGTGIGGSFVTLELLPPFPKRIPRTDWGVATDNAGSFSFDSLPIGRFRVCAQVPKGTWLNPCQWGSRPPLTILTAVQPTASSTVVMRRGAAVPIRIEDPGQRLLQYEGKVAGSHLLIGVGNDAFGFMTARLVSRDANSRTYEVVLPFDSPRNVVIRSPGFRLTDGAGVALPQTKASMVPVMVPLGQKPGEIRLTLSGGVAP